MQEKLSKANICKRIKYLRLEKGITQQFAADLFDISRSNYSQIELGNQYPTYEALIKMARYYSKSLEFLLLGIDSGTRFHQTTNPIPAYIKSKNIVFPPVYSGTRKNVLVKANEKAAYIQNLTSKSYLQTLKTFNIPPGLPTHALYRVFPVDDESMSPALQMEDQVICRPVNSSDDLIFDKLYVVVTAERIIIRKLGAFAFDEDALIFEAANPNHHFDTVPFFVIKEIWAVAGKFGTCFETV